MIWIVQPLAAGNAMRILTHAPTGAVAMRLLRKDTDDIATMVDPGSVVVFDGEPGPVVDTYGLINGEEVFYRAFFLVDGQWVDSPSAGGTPTSDFAPIGVDALSFVRDRLEAGFKTFVDRGDLVHSQGYVPVLKASPQVERVQLPLVTAHLANEASEIRGIGEALFEDTLDPEDAEFIVGEGGLDRVQLNIGIFSLNSDQRLKMRGMLKAILRANLEVFDSVGMVLPEWSMQDMEDYQTYESPMFMTVCSFSFLAGQGFATSARPIQSVSVSTNATI